MECALEEVALVSSVTTFLLCGTVGALALLCEGAAASAEGVTNGVGEGTIEGLPTPMATRAAEGRAEALEAERVVT